MHRRDEAQIRLRGGGWTPNGKHFKGALISFVSSEASSEDSDAKSLGEMSALHERPFSAASIRKASQRDGPSQYGPPGSHRSQNSMAARNPAKPPSIAGCSNLERELGPADMDDQLSWAEEQGYPSAMQRGSSQYPAGFRPKAEPFRQNQLSPGVGGPPGRLSRISERSSQEEGDQYARFNGGCMGGGPQQEARKPSKSSLRAEAVSRGASAKRTRFGPDQRNTGSSQSREENLPPRGMPRMAPLDLRNLRRDENDEDEDDYEEEGEDFSFWRQRQQHLDEEDAETADSHVHDDESMRESQPPFHAPYRSQQWQPGQHNYQSLKQQQQQQQHQQQQGGRGWSRGPHAQSQRGTAGGRHQASAMSDVQLHGQQHDNSARHPARMQQPAPEDNRRWSDFNVDDLTTPPDIAPRSAAERAQMTRKDRSANLPQNNGVSNSKRDHRSRLFRDEGDRYFKRATCRLTTCTHDDFVGLQACEVLLDDSDVLECNELQGPELGEMESLGSRAQRLLSCRRSEFTQALPTYLGDLRRAFVKHFMAMLALSSPQVWTCKMVPCQLLLAGHLIEVIDRLIPERPRYGDASDGARGLTEGMATALAKCFQPAGVLDLCLDLLRGRARKVFECARLFCQELELQASMLVRLLVAWDPPPFAQVHHPGQLLLERQGHAALLGATLEALENRGGSKFDGLASAEVALLLEALQLSQGHPLPSCQNPDVYAAKHGARLSRQAIVETSTLAVRIVEELAFKAERTPRGKEAECAADAMLSSSISLLAALVAIDGKAALVASDADAWGCHSVAGALGQAVRTRPLTLRLARALQSLLCQSADVKGSNAFQLLARLLLEESFMIECVHAAKRSLESGLEHLGSQGGSKRVAGVEAKVEAANQKSSRVLALVKCVQDTVSEVRSHAQMVRGANIADPLVHDASFAAAMEDLEKSYLGNLR